MKPVVRKTPAAVEMRERVQIRLGISIAYDIVLVVLFVFPMITRDMSC